MDKAARTAVGCIVADKAAAGGGTGAAPADEATGLPRRSLPQQAGDFDADTAGGGADRRCARGHGTAAGLRRFRGQGLAHRKERERDTPP